jgi:hypothetical protein
VSHAKSDIELTKTVFETLKRASEAIEVLLKTRQKNTWDALIEAMTPEVPMTSNQIIEAKMLAEAITRLVESHDFVRASEIAKLGQFSVTNPSSQPNRWKKAGLIFAVLFKGVDLYPLYALETKGGVKPLPAMKEILSTLQDKDDWQKAFWFASPNTYLRNKMPKDLLKSKPEAVLRAATIEAEGVQHG